MGVHDLNFFDDNLIENPSDVMISFTTFSGLQELSFGDLDAYFKTILVFAIVYGVRIGMSFIALPVTYLVTKKKNSPIFILNMITLCLLFIQSILYAVSLTDQYNSLGYYFTDSTFVNKNNSNITVASNVFYFLLIVFIQVSETYQVWIIFESPQSLMKWVCYSVTFISGALSIGTIVLYFIYMVQSNKAMFSETYTVNSYLLNDPLILFITSTCLIFGLLAIKLAFAVRTRRHLGLRQFNLFHILLIMSFQTMIIPMILILVSFNGFSETDKYSSQALSSLGTALVALSLPMTAMWANSSINSPTPTSQANTFFFSSKSSSGSDTEYEKQSPTTLVDMDLERALGNQSNIGDEENEFWKEVAMYSNESKIATDDEDDELKLFQSTKNGSPHSLHGSYVKTTIETFANK